MVKISDIGEDPMNPNTMTKQQHESLSESVDKNGFIEDILLNERKSVDGKKKYTLINGHQRVFILDKKGETKISAKIIKVTEIEARRIGWAMNRNVGQDDPEKLSNLLLLAYKKDRLDAFLQSVPMFGEDKAKLLIDKFHDTTLFQEGDELIPEVPAKSNIKEGDMFQLGSHKILCGDATNSKHIEKLFAGEKAAQINMDPPYGVNYGGEDSFLSKIHKPDRVRARIDGDGGDIDYVDFYSKMIEFVPLTDYNTVYIWMVGMRLAELTEAFKLAGFTWGDYLVWVKNHFVLGRKDHNLQHEFCLYGWKGKHKFYGENNASTVYIENSPQRSDYHPTMKPINLIARTMLEGTKPKDIVYDGCGGSGTTMIVAENENRRCFMIEKVGRYVDVIISRWETKTQRKAVKL